MWETIKKDPILKTVVVIVLGVLAFGFAFNIMFGTSGGNMDHGMGGGYSLSNTLGNTTTVLTKILLIVVLIAAIIGVVKFLKNYLIGSKEIKISETIEKSSFAKIIAVVVGILLVLTLVSGITYGTLSVLIILTKVLLFISVIGLVVGIVMYLLQTRGDDKLKVNLSIISSEKCTSCGTKVGKEFKFCPNCSAKIKKECVKCKTHLKDEWTCCPVCGDENAEEKIDITNEGVEVETQENISMEDNASSLDEKKAFKENDNPSNQKNVEADTLDGQVLDIKDNDVK